MKRRILCAVTLLAGAVLIGLVGKWTGLAPEISVLFGIGWGAFCVDRFLPL